MMTLPLPQHYHDKSKSLPTIKGDKASDTIRGPSCKERRQAFLLSKKGRLIIREKANKTIGRCVRTTYSNVFCRLIKAGIIFSWKGASIWLLQGPRWREGFNNWSWYFKKKNPSPVESCLFDVVRGVLRSTPPCCLSSTFIFDRQAPRQTSILLWICVYKIKEIVVSNFWLVLTKYHFKIKTFI